MDFDELLRQHVTQDEPPLGLTSAGMVRAAKHHQRLRAVVGAATVGTAVTLIGTLTLAAPGAPPNNFAKPEPSACTSTLRPGVPTPQSSEFLPPLDLPVPLPSTYPSPMPSPPAEGLTVFVDPSSGAVPDPATPSAWFPSATPLPMPSGDPTQIPEESLRPVPTKSVAPQLRRLTCHLVESVDRFAPRASIGSFGDPDIPPLSTYDSYQILGGHSASAVLHDEQGYGLISISVGPRVMGPAGSGCRGGLTGPTGAAACQARQGSQGQQVEIYTSAGGGRVEYTLYVWSGNTFILLTADNNALRPAPFRPTPFFTVNQLIEIATDPTLNLY